MSVDVSLVENAPTVDPNKEYTEKEMTKMLQDFQIWAQKMTLISNTMKAEHEGRMAVARNLK